MLSRRRMLAVSAGLAVNGALPFAAWAEDALVEAARKEGAGVLYTVTDPQLNDEMLRAFTARYGIPVESQRISSAPLAQRFTAEAESGRVAADVMISADSDFVDAVRARGWLAEIGPLPAMAGLPPDVWDGVAAAVQYNLFTLVWNTNLIKELPPRWDVLADPKWAGQILYFDPRNSFPNVQWLWMLRQTYGEDFLRRMGRQATLSPSSVTGIQNVAAGSAAIYAPAAHTVVGALQAKGAPIGEVIPAPAFGITILAVVPAKAPHPNVARLLLNFLMTPECQSIMNRDGVSFVANVPGTRPMPSERWKLLPTAEAKRVQPELLGLLGVQ
jgi:iron(III) transport system substrate-binding protein